MTARIAMISEHASPAGTLGGIDGGGQNVYVDQLARNLARRGFAVDVFTRKDAPDLPEIQSWCDGVRIINVPAGPACFVRKEDLLPHMAAFSDYMRDRWVELGGYDLIHANFWTSGLVAAGLKAWLGVPFVITFHALGRVRRIYQAERDEFPDERFAIEDHLVRQADAIIAECPQDRLDLMNLYSADPDKIVVIPCGFDPREFAPAPQAEARQAAGIAAEGPVILQLGRLVPRKGIDNVIRALAELRDRYSIGARLVVVGGESEVPDAAVTPEIGRLTAIAAEQGVAQSVTFTGRRSRAELAQYYNAADVFVTTPWYEPFGMTPLEAMACARPVIGSDVGGIKFTVQDGRTGLLVPPNDPTALAASLAFLLKNPDIAASMGRRGLERVNRRFTWQAITGYVAELYRGVLERQRAADLADQPALAEIDRGFEATIAALQAARQTLARPAARAASYIDACFTNGGKLLICGNGGSAADAQHFAAELVGRYRLTDRGGLPAIALTADSAILTAWSNDVGYEDVFARQVLALGRAGDVLVGITTSGRSPNVLRAFEAARTLGMTCLVLTGGNGGPAVRLADVALIVPSSDTQRIQEVHSLLIHLLCELVEAHILDREQAPEKQAPLVGASGSAPYGELDIVVQDSQRLALSKRNGRKHALRA
jgi:D-inositol-3-phosphate glycosyltransferase